MNRRNFSLYIKFSLITKFKFENYDFYENYLIINKKFLRKANSQKKKK